MSYGEGGEAELAKRANQAVEELWRGPQFVESQHARRWMLFVDGENLAIRARENLLERWNLLVPDDHRLHMKDIFIWPHRLTPHNIGFYFQPSVLRAQAERAFFFTSVKGDEDKVNKVRDRLHQLGFQPVVFKKQRGERAKGVDISLTTALLSNAFMDNYDTAIVITEDADYVPVIDEVKRIGKQVFLVTMRTDKINRDLILACDRVHSNFDTFIAHEWQEGYVPES